MKRRVLLILGTRPEAIKLCPVVRALRTHPDEFEVHVCSTGQHRELLMPIWECFGIQPDSDLDVMVPGQSLVESSSRILSALPEVFVKFRPEFTLVQGDTTTTLCGALCSFYQRVPCGHIEAGLRTGDFSSPFPEEMNRSLVARIAQLHFAATTSAAANLHREGIPANRVFVTGNTGVDALLFIKEALETGSVVPSRPMPPPAGRRVVVTMHRREAFDGGLAAICAALNELAGKPGIEIVLPLHPNPKVKEAVDAALKPRDNFLVCDPFDYVSFVALMRSASLILTDSGGVQEEAPYLGVPVVVLREKTERPEGLAGGFATIAGFRQEAILAACLKVLDGPPQSADEKMSHKIYGDGQASARIRDLIHSFIER